MSNSVERQAVGAASTAPRASGVGGRSRYIAAFIDNALAIVLAYVVAAVVSAAGSTVQFAAMPVTYFGYYMVAEAITARTLGKWIAGLRIQALDGTPHSWKHAVIRSAMRLLEVNPLLFGALPAAILIATSSKKQRLGDMLAGTVVTHVKRASTGGSQHDARCVQH